jgi:hypothetical protein
MTCKAHADREGGPDPPHAHEQQAIEKDERALAHIVEIASVHLGGTRRVVLGQGCDQFRKEITEDEAREIFRNLLFPSLAGFAGEIVECANALCRKERGFLKEQDEQAQSAIRRQPIVDAFDQVELVAGQLQGLGEIDLQKILGDRERALQIKTPDSAIGENAEPDRVVGLNIDPTQILEHLRRGDTLFAGIPFVGAIRGSIPAFRLEHGQTMLETLPLLGFADG